MRGIAALVTLQISIDSSSQCGRARTDPPQSGCSSRIEDAHWVVGAAEGLAL